jgi:hypothetical protein
MLPSRVLNWRTKREVMRIVPSNKAARWAQRPIGGKHRFDRSRHHCVKTLSICAICLPAAYWSPRCRLEAWPLLQDDVAVPVDAMELEYILRDVHAEGLYRYSSLSFLMQARSDRGRCGMGALLTADCRRAAKGAIFVSA